MKSYNGKINTNFHNNRIPKELSSDSDEERKF